MDAFGSYSMDAFGNQEGGEAHSSGISLRQTQDQIRPMILALCRVLEALLQKPTHEKRYFHTLEPGTLAKLLLTSASFKVVKR
jgi:hypothetical protein